MISYELLLDEEDNLEFDTDLTSYLRDFASARGFGDGIDRIQAVGELKLWLDWRELIAATTIQYVSNPLFDTWSMGVPTDWQLTVTDDDRYIEEVTNGVRIVNNSDNITMAFNGALIAGVSTGSLLTWVIELYISDYMSGSVDIGLDSSDKITVTGGGLHRITITYTAVGASHYISIVPAIGTDLVIERVDVRRTNIAPIVERGRWIQLNATLDAVEYPIFTGMIYGLVRQDERIMQVICRKRTDFMGGAIQMPVQINARSDVVFDAILHAGRYQIRDELFSTIAHPVTGNLQRFGVVGKSKVGSSVVAPSNIARRITDVGRTVFPYFGELDGIAGTLNDLLRNCVESEGGWLYEDQAGYLVFRNRSYTIHQTTASYTVDFDEVDADYTYGENVITELTAEYIPRAVELQTIVWTLAQDWRVPFGESVHQIHISDDKGRSVGLFGEVSIEDLVSDFPVDIYPRLHSNVLELTIINRGGAKGRSRGSKALISSGMKIRCDAIYQDERVTVNRRTAVYHDYGSEHKHIGSGTFSNLDTIDALIAFYGAAYGNLEGKIASITFKSEVEEQLSIDLLDRVSAVDVVNYVSDDYLVRRIEHTIVNGRLHTIVHLNPYDDELYGIVGIEGRMEVGSIKVGY